MSRWSRRAWLQATLGAGVLLRTPLDAAAQAVDSRSQRPQAGDRFVFAEGAQTWADAIGARLDGRTLATVELGTAGHLQALLGGAPYLLFGELVADEPNLRHAATDLGHFANRVREIGHADIGVALLARQIKDTHVRIAIATADGVEEMTRVAFLAGDEGRRRAALACAAALWHWLVANHTSRVSHKQ